MGPAGGVSGGEGGAELAQTPARVGAVAIGRNEGERLRRCLESLRHVASTIVYVDSGSLDASVALAAGLGAVVVELDGSLPFTAARARNAGLAKLRELEPGAEFVQFIDGDCELAPGWVASALAKLRSASGVAVVCGRRRERHPEASIYNRLCDIEWNGEGCLMQVTRHPLAPLVRKVFCPWGDA